MGDPVLLACLTHLKCEQFVSIFEENEIDFDCFKLLTPEDLAGLLPGKLGPQKRLLQEIQRIQEIDKGNLKETTPSNPVVVDNPPEAVATKGPLKKETVVRPNVSAPVKLTVVEGKEAKPTESSADKPKTTGNDLLTKYGFVLPTVGGFAAAVVVDTAKKYLIDKYTYPMIDGGSKPGGEGVPPPPPADGEVKPMGGDATGGGGPTGRSLPPSNDETVVGPTVDDIVCIDDVGIGDEGADALVSGMDELVSIF